MLFKMKEMFTLWKFEDNNFKGQIQCQNVGIKVFDSSLTKVNMFASGI